MTIICIKNNRKLKRVKQFLNDKILISIKKNTGYDVFSLILKLEFAFKKLPLKNIFDLNWRIFFHGKIS